MSMQGQQAKINQDVAIALERLNGRMESWELWRKEIDDERRRYSERKDERIEQQPDTIRNTFSTYGGCLASVIFAALSLLSLVIGSAGLILSIMRH